MRTYFEQLQYVARSSGIDLMLAFKNAGVPTSTYYRSSARNDMRYKTAIKVMNGIQNLQASKSASGD